VVLNGTANGNGVASVALPAEAGDLTNPPVVACYISSDGSSWIIIAFDIDTDTDVDTNTDVAGFLGCFLDPGAANNIAVVAEGVPPGWLLRVVIVY
jgi:hypothetical protein